MAGQSRLKVCCFSRLSFGAQARSLLRAAQSEPTWLIAEVAPRPCVGTRLNRSVKMWGDEVNTRGGK